MFLVAGMIWEASLQIIDTTLEEVELDMTRF